MKKCLICFICSIFSFCLCSCCSAKPVATTHTERIETHLQPIPIGADTIEIVLSHTDDLSHTECTDNTEYAVATPAEDRLINDFEQSEKSNSVGSVRNKNPVRISSTRGVNISRHETDTTSTLRITLRPDTVFVPYINHIRSDTIVVPDRVCQQKLNHSNMTNLFLILILIAIFIIYLRKSIAHRQ